MTDMTRHDLDDEDPDFDEPAENQSMPQRMAATGKPVRTPRSGAQGAREESSANAGNRRLGMR